MKKRLVQLGVIAGPHGVRGLAKLRSFTECAEDITAYGPLCDETGERQFALRITGQARGLLIVEIESVHTPEAVRALRGTGLYAPRERLPEPEEDDSFLMDDLIGLAVFLPEGEAYGTIAAVDNYGAGDIVTIHRSGGKEEMALLTHAAFPDIDLAAGRVTYVPAEPLTVPPEGQG